MQSEGNLEINGKSKHCRVVAKKWKDKVLVMSKNEYDFSEFKSDYPRRNDIDFF